MPSLDTYKKMLNKSGKNIGQVHKYNADLVMEYTWDNDIQSKVCYIYDYFHDDKPDLADGITHENTTKTQIDAKFIITQYGSLSKDQVEYHIMFKPSQPVKFTKEDELYYYETEFSLKYGAIFPIGLYIDVPDDRGVYHKWLICSKEISNQFVKYSILPCNYYLHWIEQNGNMRTKRKMWGVLRSQNSYNSGLWTDRYITSIENQDKIWLPLNSITSKLYYTNRDGDGRNQRLIVSAPVEHPNVWQISKVENTNPFGIQKITLYQDSFNPHTDYVNLDTNEMYADYYSSDIEPNEENMNEEIAYTCKIKASTNTIKLGGSYKSLTAIFYDNDGKEVSDEIMTVYKLADNDGDHITDNDGDGIVTSSVKWRCYIGDKDMTGHKDITWSISNTGNKIKVKIANNPEYLGKILTIKTCLSLEPKICGETNLEIISI